MGFITDFFAGGKKPEEQIEGLKNLQLENTTGVPLNFAEYLSQSKGITAPQVGESSFRGGQEQLVSQMQAQAAGQGPSLAQLQLQQGTDAAIAAQAAQAASARGISPALAQRLAAQNSAGIMGQQASQSGLLRLQEQQQAQQALAGLLGQARGQDVTVGSTNAQLAAEEQKRKDMFLQQLLQMGLARDVATAQTRAGGLSASGGLSEQARAGQRAGVDLFSKMLSGVSQGLGAAGQGMSGMGSSTGASGAGAGGNVAMGGPAASSGAVIA